MSGYVPRHSRSKENAEPASAHREDLLPSLEGFENPLIVPGETSTETGDAALSKIRRRRWPVIIAIILAAIVISGAVTYFVLASQASEREASRAAVYGALDEAIALIQESDQVVVALDSATVTEVTEADLAERQALLERVPDTLETLDSAEEYVNEALELIVSGDDKDFAEQITAAITNRRDMLTSGKAIITKDIEAMNSALLFGSAWELVVAADAELRTTTELSRTGNMYSLQEAIERNQAVASTLEQAATLIAQAGEAFSEADFSTVETYLTLKRESVALAIEADQAVLNGDLATVNAKNTEFGLKDAEVVEAASLIPANPLTLITDAYETSTADDRALYDSARANAADADVYIREYVGVETQTGVQ